MSFSELLEWSEEIEDHFISLRKADGSVSGPWLVLPSETPSRVALQDELDFMPYTGELQERTHIAFGAGEKWSTLARVTAIRPRGELVEISAVAENPVVHTADQ